MFQGRGWRFQALGVPVTVSPWFLIVVLFGLDYLRLGVDFFLIYVIVVFVSVLVHELGHAFAMRRFEQQPQILLQGYIGLTYGSAPYRTRREDILTSLAGPFTQILLLGVPAWAIGHAFDLYGRLFFLVYITKWVSLLWGFINLLPVLPLDGGHVAQALWGRPAARRISVVTCALALVYIFSQGYTSFWLLPILLGGFNAYEIYMERRSSTGPQVVFLPPSPGEYGGGLGGGDYGPPRRQGRSGRPQSRAQARRKASHLRPVPDTPEELVGSMPTVESKVDKVEAVAWSALREGRVDDAKRALAKVPPGAEVDPFLRPAVDLVAGDTDPAVAGFEAAYVARPEGPSGLLPATLIGQHGEARTLALRILGHQGGGPAFAASGLQGHLHYARHFAQSAIVGELLWNDDRANRAQVAFEVACSWSRAGDVPAALRWIERAIGAGFDSGATLDREADLADTRADPGWKTVRSLLS